MFELRKRPAQPRRKAMAGTNWQETRWAARSPRSSRCRTAWRIARMMGLPPEMGLFTSILTAPVTSLLGRNPVLIGGTAKRDGSVHRRRGSDPRDGGSGQGLPRGVGFHDDLLHVAAGPLRGESAARGCLGFFVRRGCHDGDSSTSNDARSAVATRKLRRKFVARASSSHEDSAADALGAIGAWLDCGGRRGCRGAAMAAITGAFARRCAGRRRRSVLGWRERVLGAVSLSLPEFAGFTWGPADMSEILPSALGLAFVASVNILITSRVVEHFQGRHRPLRGADADAELGAYGIANLCAGVFGCPLSVGIPARSLANLRCGGTTRLSNLLHAVFLLALASFCAGLIADSAGGPGRGDSLRGAGATGMEHMAKASADAQGRCACVSLDGGRGAFDQRRRRGGHRLLLLCGAPSCAQAHTVRECAVIGARNVDS